MKLHTLGDSSVNFVVRPWVKTEDYWDVYWDLTREVKMRFDKEGISIPFPQRDVHLYNAQADARELVLPAQARGEAVVKVIRGHRLVVKAAIGGDVEKKGPSMISQRILRSASLLSRPESVRLG